jgi:hypothetical protein
MPDLLSAPGQRILAHELTHVVQQSAATQTGVLPVSSPGDAGELEAADTAARVTPSSARLSVQRDPDPQAAAPEGNTALKEGVTAEKWSETLEAAYRSRGDVRRANAIRACRVGGGRACGLVLTNHEMWNLYRLSKDSGGDEAKIRAGLAAAAPSLGSMIGPGVSPPPGFTLPPGFTPPSGFTPPGFAPPTVTPQVPLPPTSTPPVSPGPAAGAAEGAAAGLSLEAAITIAGVTAIVAICVISALQLWDLGKFQQGLEQRGFIILEDSLAVCIGQCHQPTHPHAGDLPSHDPFEHLPELIEPLPQDELRRWLEGQKGQQAAPQPAPVPNPRTGDCTEAQHEELQAEVDRQCKRLPSACRPDMTKAELKRNAFRNWRCARARDKVNDECFKGGNEGHKRAAKTYWEAYEKCWDLYQRADKR